MLTYSFITCHTFESIYYVLDIVLETEETVFLKWENSLLKRVKLMWNINIFQMDPHELARHYRSSTKFQVGDLQPQNYSSNPLPFYL